MSWKFNPPPGWPPQPAGWTPQPGWQPDPTWPPPPAGWQFWVPADATPTPTATPTAYGPPGYGPQPPAPGHLARPGEGSRPWFGRWWGILGLVLALLIGVLLGYGGTSLGLAESAGPLLEVAP